MLELVLLAVVGVGLYRKRGERWEWSRQRLEEAFRGLSSGSYRIAMRARRSVPELLGQCGEDMRGLGADLFGLLSPNAQSQIERRTRSLKERTAKRGKALSPRGFSDA